MDKPLKWQCCLLLGNNALLNKDHPVQLSLLGSIDLEDK
jgi:hypothetical protein